MVIFAKKKTEMNLFEVNKSSDIGLEPVREFNLYGKIQVLLLFRYKVSFFAYTPKGKYQFHAGGLDLGSILICAFRMRLKIVSLF